jgi:two-component system phosphate regulon sensor histidine kinase PhoR
MQVLCILFFTLFLFTLIVAIHGGVREHKQQLHQQMLQKNLLALQKKNSFLEQNLQKEQDIVQLIQKHMAESILILDDCDKIKLANDSAIDLLKIDRALLETHSIFTLTDHTGFLDALRMTKKNGALRHLLTIDGQDYRAYIRRVALTDRNGTIILLINVTESVRAEKIRTEFTANVSHELKTPLTVIKGFGEMFGSGMIQNPDDVRRYGTMIQRESERLLFLINDIIRLSEIEEHTEKQLSCIDLHTVAENTLRILSDQARLHDITLHADCQHIHIMGNETDLQELLTNLVDNAIKYNNAGGWVQLTIGQQGQSAIICVKDNGIGIPKSAQERIFERFYRVDKSRSKERGGTGLGLSIVKHIVEYQKGTITLHSELKKGTEITLLLPLDCTKTE